VLSPGNSADEMNTKIAKYLAVGTMVWRIDPIAQEVAVFDPASTKTSSTIYRIGDVLDGGTVLPGFTLELARLFR
jgi:Uma2 family endonuclease